MGEKRRVGRSVEQGEEDDEEGEGEEEEGSESRWSKEGERRR